VSRRATIEIPGEVWDQEAARQWWKTHLPDTSGWIDLAADPIAADRLTSETGVRAQPESAWIVPVRMD